MAKPLYSKELADEVIGGIATGLCERDAAAAAGISEDTLERWKKGQSKAPADFADRLTRAKPKRTRRWLSRLGQAADAGDVKAICELLDRCAPDYRKTERIEHTGADGAPLTVFLSERPDGPA